MTLGVGLEVVTQQAEFGEVAAAPSVSSPSVSFQLHSPCIVLHLTEASAVVPVYHADHHQSVVVPDYVP